MNNQKKKSTIVDATFKRNLEVISISLETESQFNNETLSTYNQRLSNVTAEMDCPQEIEKIYNRSFADLLFLYLKNILFQLNKKI